MAEVLASVGAASAAGVTAFVTSPQVARPDADVSNDYWSASTGSDLYAMLDEYPYASDADYILARKGAVAKVALSNVYPPLSDDGHVVRFRAKGSGARFTVALMCGLDTIATWNINDAANAWTTYERTLTTVQADAIADYDDLTVVLTSSATDYYTTEAGVLLQAEDSEPLATDMV